MKLFTKEIDKKLFEQYSKGSDLNNQVVVAKVFNPYGRGTWYLLNADPEDPEYIWAITNLFEIEVGSVNRSDLENIKFKPFMLGLERDLFFEPVNAMELYKGLQAGEKYAKGGGVEYPYKSTIIVSNEKYSKVVIKKHGAIILNEYETQQGYEIVIGSYDWKVLDNVLKELKDKNVLISKYANGGNVEKENAEMVKSYNKQIAHHTKEMAEAMNKDGEVPAWVVAKMTRSASDLSDATHYMESGEEKYENGGGLENYYRDKSRFPDAGEIVFPKDVDYDMMYFFARTNAPLRITLKDGSTVKSSVGKFYNDLIFHGDLPNKDSNYKLQLKDIENILVLNSYETGGTIVAFPEDLNYKYHVVSQDADNYLTVQEENYEAWKKASDQDKADLWSEWIPKSEMVVIKNETENTGTGRKGWKNKK